MADDDVKVREALARFTDATGWFTADRDIHDRWADIRLTADQIDVLTLAVRVMAAARQMAGLFDN